MLFRLKSDDNGQSTHCGVLEFTAEEGTCYIPFWMMQNLLIQEGEVITVTNVSLPKAKMIKLKPQSVDFLEISNPKAVLEFALRNYTCVTKGDVIQIPYNNRNYQFELLDVQPQDAVCIVETDCNLEFDAPVGYVDPSEQNNMGNVGTAMTNSKNNNNNNNNSACPSPQTTSAASSVTAMEDDDNNNATSSGVRIVNGQVIRSETNKGPSTDMLAEKTGATGVQANAAIPSTAPDIDYWAVHVGDSHGARLDGKKPAELKDAQGNVVDVRKLRAEAAAKRAAEAAAAHENAATKLAASTGVTVAGEVVAPEPEAAAAAAAASKVPVSKRKSRTGNKFSKLKGAAAFQGNANNLG